jgi:hypothetical protein
MAQKNHRGFCCEDFTLQCESVTFFGCKYNRRIMLYDIINDDYI